MNPEKIEELLKESLGKKAVSPSEASWNQIASRLDADLKPLRRIGFGKAYWAAAGLLLLIGLRLLLPIDSNAIEERINAALPQPEVISSTTTEGAVPNRSSSDTPKETTTGDGPSIITYKDSQPVSDLAEVKPLRKNESQGLPVAIALRASTEIAEAIETGQSVQGSDTPIDVNPNMGQEPLVDSEIDALLHAALNAVVETASRKSKDSVNSSQLLAEVEDELDQSFRAQFFDKLKTQIGKVRMAVATRND